MDTRSRKNLCEIYGLVRMILGVGLIVGLSAGYFLKEWLAKYPSDVIPFIMDKDLIALTYLAVIMRSLFHTVTGVGIARVQSWVKLWIYYGWPILVIMNVGLINALCENWQVAGYINASDAVISWPKVLVYMLIVGFDYFFIVQSINQVNRHYGEFTDGSQRIALKKVSLVLIIALFSFSVLLFLGRPIKQGFHPGFYKSRGKVVDTKTSTSKKVNVLVPKKKTKKAEPVAYKPLVEEKKVVKKVETIKPILQEVVVKPIVIDEKQPTKTRVKKVEGKIEKKEAAGMPYRKMIGYIGGFCFILALLLHVIELYCTDEIYHIPLSFYFLFSVGFLLWIVYGFSYGLWPVTITGIASFGLTIAIIFYKFR